MSRQADEELTAAVVDELRASQTATDRLDALAAGALGVNRTDARCLDLLGQAGEALSAGRLAELSGLTTAAITGVIDRLEARGYVERVPDPADRRRVLVGTTPLLRERAGAIWGPLGDEGRRALVRFDTDELRAILRFLRASRDLNERHAERIGGLRFDRP